MKQKRLNDRKKEKKQIQSTVKSKRIQNKKSKESPSNLQKASFLAQRSEN